MAATVLDGDSDSPIRVTVVPSQASFFAGEEFVVSITFTNTRSPNGPSASKARRGPALAHKRAAHSISSAPLARPPTSPMTPRTAVPTMAYVKSTAEKKVERRGLIGPGRKELVDPLGADRGNKGHTAKALSATVRPEELQGVLESIIPAPVPQPSRNAPLPLNHPHARKQSIFDGTVQLQDMVPSPVQSPFPPSAATSVSTFALSLDPISEAGVSSFSSQSPSPSPIVGPPSHSYPPKPTGKRPPHIGIGHPQIDNKVIPPPPRTAHTSTFSPPNTEVILYSYVQLSGALTLASPPNAEDAPSVNSLRSVLSQGQVIGGGSMDISSSVNSPHLKSTHARRSHSRAASLSSSIMSLLSPASSTSSLAPPSIHNYSQNGMVHGHKSRSSSIFGAFISPSPTPSNPQNKSVGLGISGTNGTNNKVYDVDPDTPLPIFEVQPTMLAVDLSIEPGESRTYVYRLSLPANIPPTFRGRAMKIAYNVAVGICRAGSTPFPPSQGNGSTSPNPSRSSTSTSRVMKVPIRVYNHVSVWGSQSPYDLLWPVKDGKKLMMAQPQTVNEATKTSLLSKGKGKILPALPTAPTTQSGSLAGLRECAERLLSVSASDPTHAGTDGTNGAGTPLSNGTGERVPVTSVPKDDQDADQDAGEVVGCREAIEILTRSLRRVSYDVNKDGVQVAVLTFVQPSYRLGETVLGVLELNERPSSVRVLKLSAFLEAHETLPQSLLSSRAGPSKKVHDEHHSSLVSNNLRTTFSLNIPSDATPTFQCNASGWGNQLSGSKAGGLEWKVRICLLVAVASPHAFEGFDNIKVKQLVRDGPPGEWGAAWRATEGIAPLQRLDPKKVRDAEEAARASAANSPKEQPKGWTAYFMNSIFSGEREYHDGDEEVDEDEDEHGNGSGLYGSADDYGLAVDETGEIDIGGGDLGWEGVKVETVECEVPIRVWPGNTAFRPAEVVFDV